MTKVGRRKAHLKMRTSVASPEPGPGRAERWRLLRRWYLRLMGLFYVYGAAVHGANLLGYGPEVPVQHEQFYRVLDAIYLLFDVVTSVGLLVGQVWGVTLLLTTAGSQVAIYLGFLDFFANDAAERALLLGLVAFHLLTAAGLGVLSWLSARRDAPVPPPARS